MNIWHLKTFIVLAQEKNFSKTADRIHRSQSAVSLQIKNLEEEHPHELGDALCVAIEPRVLAHGILDILDD